jgi:uncharacterized protein YkwD
MRLCLAAMLFATATYAADMPMEAAKSEAQTAETGKSETESGQSSSPNAQATQRPRPFHRQSVFLGMLRRNNDVRRRAGLFAHRLNPALTAAAQDHANYMARTGQFSHYVNGGPQYRANKYGFRAGVRENIAYGTRSIDGAFNMWVNSGAHYASIVSGTTEAGFGYAVSSSGTAYWVGVYASPARGDAVGETEADVATFLAEEEAAKEAERKAEEKNVAANEPANNQPADSNVVPASAAVPAVASSVPAESASQASAAPAPPAATNPAGNVAPMNSRPGNTYYYNSNSDNNQRRRWFRRRS